MFRVALVVIARNEERRIGRLLDSLRSKLEAMVVLDTGSDDATADQARMHGARVAHQAWTDDFSAARNAALDLASADWHLVLDADEWLIDGGGFLEQLRHTPPDFVGQILLEDDGATEGTTSGTTRNWLSRLLPGHVRYQGRIHEQPVHQLPVRRTPLRVGHDGYSAEALDAKRGRNRRLLERALEEQPEDAYLMYQLGKDASVYAEHALADRWFRAAWPRVALQASWRTDLLVRWLSTLKHLGWHAEGARLAETEALTSNHSPDFHFAVGDLMLDWTAGAPASAQQLLDLAERSWRRCLQLGDRPEQSGAVQGRGSHLAAFNLALVLEGTGRSAEAANLRQRFGLPTKPLLN
jgi:glycosyltransferase involved in cell wall biosynthesis